MSLQDSLVDAVMNDSISDDDRYNLISDLLKKGANANLVHEREPILCHVLSLKEFKIAQLLIHHGANVNARVEGTPLIENFMRDYETVEFLVKSKADINCFTESVPLLLSVIWNDNDVRKVDLLIKAGANVNAKCDGMSIFWHTVCKSGDINLEIIKSLLKAGANVNIKVDGYNLLHTVIEHNQVDLLKILVNAGIDVNQKPLLGGLRPLRLAEMKGNNEIVDILLKSGAKR